MKRVLVITLISAAVIFALDSRLASSDKYFLNRHKESTYLSKARSLCREVLEAKPDNPDALWRMSRIYMAYGHDACSKSAKISHYEKSNSYAVKARNANPSSPDALLFYGASLSGIIAEKGLAAAASEGMKVKQAFEKAISIDPVHAFSLGALGIWYFTAPGLAGGSTDKAITYLKKSVNADPHYSLPYVYLGKAYIKKKDYLSARTWLKKCTNITDPTTPADFYTRDRPDAEQLISEISGK